MKRSFLSFLPAISLFLGNAHAAENPLPNILLIVADDLGIELGCYGDRRAQTPNIDKLAQEGVRFKTAWVTAASCSPSRGSIHTGLYPHQNGLVGLAHHGFSFNQEYPTTASLLKNTGYRTGIIGKFHVSPKEHIPWDFKFTPEDDPDAEQIRRKLLGDQRDVRGMANMAEGFMSGNTGPFFLMMSYVDPHVPLIHQAMGLPENPLAAEDVEPLPFLGFDSPALRERTAGYYNCIQRLDHGIGLLLDALTRTGKSGETLVILVGDHGAPFARAKITCYDRGLRVPLIIRPPGDPASKAAENQPASTIDILPTIADYVGIELPRELPGRSLRPLLRGDLAPDSARPLFASHHAHQKDAVFPMRAIRSNQWLLIHNLDSGRQRPRPAADGSPLWPSPDANPLPGVPVDSVYETFLRPPEWELYNLEADPYCFVNLADDPRCADQIKDLKSKLAGWRRDTDNP